MLYPAYTFAQLDAMEPTARLKTLRELMRAKDPTFDLYMRRAADTIIEHYADTQRHLEDVYQDQFEAAFVEASIHDKVRQALYAVDPTNPALDAVPPSYGVWEKQRARISALEAQVKALTADRDAQAEAVRVLGGECFEWRLAHVCNPVSLIDAPIIRARKRTMNNPIATAAVKGVG